MVHRQGELDCRDISQRTCGDTFSQEKEWSEVLLKARSKRDVHRKSGWKTDETDETEQCLQPGMQMNIFSKASRQSNVELGDTVTSQTEQRGGVMPIVRPGSMILARCC